MIIVELSSRMTQSTNDQHIQNQSTPDTRLTQNDFTTKMIPKTEIPKAKDHRPKTLMDKFQDIGLYSGLDKCATVNFVRGTIGQSANVNLNNDEQQKNICQKR